MKLCMACGESKDVSEFHDGNRCKICYNAHQLAWYHSHKESVRKKYRDKRKENPEPVRAKEKQYWDNHREQKREKDRRFIAKDPERNRQRAAKWLEENRERANQNSRNYYQKHREEISANVCNKRNEMLIEERQLQDHAHYEKYKATYVKNAMNSRVRKSNAIGSHTNEEWDAKLAEYGGKCALCGNTENMTRDHIVPLFVGGSDFIENIQLLCRSCNARKGTSLI